jgi:hypothetical protein
MNLYNNLIKLTFAVVLIASSPLSAQVDFIWSKGFGSTGTDYGHFVTTDSLGNIFLTGEFQNTVNFPGGVSMTSQGNYDYFLVKFDKNGNALWKRNAGSGAGSFPERGFGVKIDHLGNIITCGSFFNTTTWEGGANPSISITSAGNLDGFIAKYNATGDLLWVQPQASPAQVYTYKVAIDQSNNIINCGYFGSGTDTTCRFDTITIGSNGKRDAFVSKYDPNGHALWAITAGGSSDNDQANDVVVDSVGNVYMCGISTGASNFSGIIVNCDTTDSWKNGLTADAVVAKYSPSGNIIWAKNFGGHNSDNAYELTLDGLGHLYVAGNFDSSAVFGSLGIINSNGTKGPDAFLLKLDTAGNALWVRTGGGAGVPASGSEYGYSVVVDKSGNPWFCGSFQGNATFSGSQIISKGSEDIFIAEYSPAGSLLFLKRAGGTDIDRALNMCVNPQGNILVTGRFRALADFGSVNLTTVGGDDFFLSEIGTASITSPAGNEVWQASIYHNITWNSNIDGQLKIEISTDNGTSWSILKDTVSCFYGCYTFQVPSIESVNCKIRLSSITYTNLVSTSNVFTITNTAVPNLLVSSPNTNVLWKAGYSYNITWLLTGSVSNVKLEYTTNNGNNWMIITGSVPASSQSYSWLVPNTPSNSCRVRISDSLNSALNDVSDSLFTIQQQSLPVELSSFNSNTNGRNITLNWETKTELNSEQFEIDRATVISQGKISAWSNVGSVKAAGTSVSSNQYRFTEKNLQSGKYQYRLKMIDNNGSFKYSSVIESDIELPAAFGLSQNYPNPFNPSTSINYQIPVDSKVLLEVYNITGQKVAVIINQDQSAGYYTAPFGSSALASGVYIYRIISIEKATGHVFSSNKKMMLLK